MSVKSANLRFLLALGSTKIVVLQNQEDLHIYSKPKARVLQNKTHIAPEHVAEALVGK